MSTILTNVTRRVRLNIGDFIGDQYDDSVVENAVLDYLEDSITPVNGIVYTITTTIDETGTHSVVDPEFPKGLSRLVGAGAGLIILRSEAISAARGSISMDSPSGRVNLTDRAKSLLALVTSLENEIVDAWYYVDVLIPTTKFVDTTGFETGRIEGGGTTTSSSF